MPAGWYAIGLDARGLPINWPVRQEYGPFATEEAARTHASQVNASYRANHKTPKLSEAVALANSLLEEGESARQFLIRTARPSINTVVSKAEFERGPYGYKKDIRIGSDGSYCCIKFVLGPRELRRWMVGVKVLDDFYEIWAKQTYLSDTSSVANLFTDLVVPLSDKITTLSCDYFNDTRRFTVAVSVAWDFFRNRVNAYGLSH